MKKRNVFWGVFFLFTAGVFVLFQLGFLQDIGLRNLLFAVPLSALLIASAVHRAFFGVFLPAGILLYLFKDTIGLPNLQFWPIIITVVLASIGFQILFGKRYNFSFHSDDSFRQGNFPEEAIGDDSANELSFEASFTGVTKYLYSQEQQRVYCKANFSGVKIYFDQAQLHSEGATLYLDCRYSGVEIYVPRAWKIIDNVSATLGGVEIKHAMPSDGQSNSTLTLSGYISLSGISVIRI